MPERSQKRQKSNCDHKIHFSDSMNGFNLVMLVKLPFFLFSSHNFGEVAVIQKFQYRIYSKERAPRRSFILGGFRCGA